MSVIETVGGVLVGLALLVLFAGCWLWTRRQDRQEAQKQAQKVNGGSGGPPEPP